MSVATGAPHRSRSPELGDTCDESEEEMPPRPAAETGVDQESVGGSPSDADVSQAQNDSSAPAADSGAFESQSECQRQFIVVCLCYQ